MTFRIEFAQTARQWRGRMVRADGQVLFGFKCDKKQRTYREPNPHGESEAFAQLFKRINGYDFRAINLESFDQFKQVFLAQVQSYCVHLCQGGIIAVPENYCAEFWTATNIVQMAGATKPGKAFLKRWEHRRLEEYLLFNWESKKLWKLNARELAAEANKALGSNWKPDAVRKMAYRLDLLK